MTKVNYPILTHTPIKEIVLSISYDGYVDPTAIRKFCELKNIKNEFDSIEPTRTINIKIEGGKADKPVLNSEGFILRNDKNKILQLRIGSISIHLIDDYISMEELCRQLQSYWNNFLEITKKVSISNISVRYLNLIKSDEHAAIDDYLKIFIAHPFEKNNSNQFCQLNLIQEDVNISIVSTKGEMNGENGIVLDNTFQMNVENETAFQNFRKLHEIKNDFFFKAITEKTLKLYQL